MDIYMLRCRALVESDTVWVAIFGWDWEEAYSMDWAPERAVATALVDVLAPIAAEVVWIYCAKGN
jgi:hypothetical protein